MKIYHEWSPVESCRRLAIIETVLCCCAIGLKIMKLVMRDNLINMLRRYIRSKGKRRPAVSSLQGLRTTDRVQLTDRSSETK